MSRSGRLRADLGGIYFNVLFILILAGVYAATGFRPLLVVLALHHLLILHQLLPFVRLDGYYVVSDHAGVPDLFRHIRPVLSRLVLGTAPGPALTALRRRPRALVTAWVLVTVPLLAVCALLLALRLPGVAGIAWDSAGLQSRALTSALRQGAPVAAAVSSLQLLFLTIPLVGLGLTVLRVAGVSGRGRAPRCQGR